MKCARCSKETKCAKEAINLINASLDTYMIIRGDVEDEVQGIIDVLNGQKEHLCPSCMSVLFGLKEA